MSLWHAGWALLPPLFSALPPERARAFQSWGLRPFCPFPTRGVLILWRRRRWGFPGGFYKCQSAGTAGTSLSPLGRRRSSERHQSSAGWESWRSFWSALGCDSQCLSGMRQRGKEWQLGDFGKLRGIQVTDCELWHKLVFFQTEQVWVLRGSVSRCKEALDLPL